MAYDTNNIFAKILRGEVPSVKVYEDDKTLAFMDVMPQADGHTLVVPKEPAENILELSPEGAVAMIKTAQKVAKETARIATKAIARADKTRAASDETKVKTSSLGKSKAKIKASKRTGMSGLDAAAKVLADAGKPLTSQEMVEAMTKGGLWKTSGKTPHSTIYAAIIREIAKKGSGSRFRKTDRGHFTVAKSAK